MLLVVYELVYCRFLVLPSSFYIFFEITEYICSGLIYTPKLSLNIKVTEKLYHRFLLLDQFCFCETHFTKFTTYHRIVAERDNVVYWKEPRWRSIINSDGQQACAFSILGRVWGDLRENLPLRYSGPAERKRIGRGSYAASGYTPRDCTSLPGREAKFVFSGFITTNKQTNKRGGVVVVWKKA